MINQNLREAGKILKKLNLQVACAESATAGHLTMCLALLPESGDILKGGIVCYDKTVKQSLLQIPEAVIDKFTPESAEVTRALAENLRNLIEAGVYIAITGLLAPGGSETEEKPVGTIFIHFLISKQHHAFRYHFKGTPEEITNQVIDTVGNLLVTLLKND